MAGWFIHGAGLPVCYRVISGFRPENNIGREQKEQRLFKKSEKTKTLDSDKSGKSSILLQEQAEPTGPVQFKPAEEMPHDKQMRLTNKNKWMLMENRRLNIIKNLLTVVTPSLYVLTHRLPVMLHLFCPYSSISAATIDKKQQPSRQGKMLGRSVNVGNCSSARPRPAPSE